MAKRARKTVKTEAELAEIEADRIAAHEVAVSEIDEALAEIEADKEPAEDESKMEPGQQLSEHESEVEEGAEEEPKEPNSIVKDKFKNRYIENAVINGVAHKAAKRSNWDWLSQQIAGYCLNEKHSINMDKFVALLDTNGIDHSRWTNRNRGWEGRFRMTGRVALQKVVAESGWLKFPDSDEASDIHELAPPEWRARYKKGPLAEKAKAAE